MCYSAHLASAFPRLLIGRFSLCGALCPLDGFSVAALLPPFPCKILPIAAQSDSSGGCQLGLGSQVNISDVSTVGSVTADFDSRLAPATISHQCFLDSAPLAINHELIEGMIELRDILYGRLGPYGVYADAEREKLFRAPPNVQATGEELLTCTRG